MKKINFKNIINNFKDNKLKKYYLVVPIVTLLVLVGGTYAYFTIITSGDGLSTLISGKGSNLGNPTMVMKTSNLYLNVNASMMSEDKIGTEYLATTSPDELAYGVSTSDTTALYINYFKTVQAYCESVDETTCGEKSQESFNETFPDGNPSNNIQDVYTYFKLLQEKLSTVADVPDDVKTAREAVDNADNEEALKEISNHIYTLATVSLPDGDETLNCTYKFKVTASVKNEISDNSDQSVEVGIGENFIDIFRGNYDNVVSDGTSLGDAVTVGEDGVIVSGTILGLTPGGEKNIEILASLYNTENTQDDLIDNSYTINIEQVGFECYLPDWMNNVEGHMDFAEVSLSTKTDTSGESEINYLVSSISSDTKLYGMKYCINTKESIKNCEWVNINSESYSSSTKKYSKSIDYELTDYDKYYFHLMNNDGYVFTKALYVSSLANRLIASNTLWQSGLEGDGYRFTGTGVVCSYDNRNYVYPAINQSTAPTCPTLYNYTKTKISDSTTTNYTYEDYCPSDSSTYTYSCTKLTAESIDSSNAPNNFICFGTTDKDTCTANPSTYMYRIIGVFADENGNNHVKLIKYTQLGSYAWHSSYTTNTDWADSDLYKGLNGSYFLTNTTYSYMQDNTWLNKITDWKWTAVNTKTYDGSSGPRYYNSLSPSNIYLHEMNRSNKTSTIGEWTTPTAKIGLMYVSDYALSLGSTALTMITGTYTNRTTLKTGWLHQSNNDTTASSYEWTISRIGAIGSAFSAWYVSSAGDLYSFDATVTLGASPVLYLESDVVGSGEGTLSDPYILN